jgi:small subunit ribosomal protein S1
VDGLLHITDMSYGRVPSIRNGADWLEPEVKVLDIDWERERILGLKQLQPYPWQNVAAKYPVGTRVGKCFDHELRRVRRARASIEGLVHTPEMSRTRNAASVQARVDR